MQANCTLFSLRTLLYFMVIIYKTRRSLGENGRLHGIKASARSKQCTFTCNDTNTKDHQYFVEWPLKCTSRKWLETFTSNLTHLMRITPKYEKVCAVYFVRGGGRFVTIQLRRGHCQHHENDSKSAQKSKAELLEYR